jgi:predicted RNA-binding Zn-ribbon protein involved in translation (DUF1610 family)
MSSHGLPAIFFIVWTVLCVAGWSFFWKGSLAAKRRWHGPIQVGAAVLFLAFVAAIAPPKVLAIFAPAVAAITFLNLKFTKFCPACGSMLMRNPPWVPLRFCPKCGENLASGQRK